MMRKTNILDIVGVGPLGLGSCILVFAVSWKIDKAAEIASLYGNKVLHNVLAAVLLLAAAIVFYAAIRVLPFSKHNKCFITHGIHSYLRHPRYAAIVFLIYPAFALLVHSSLCLISTLLAYVIFRLSVILEERRLIQLFGQDYKDYMKRTPGFIPKIRRRQADSNEGLD